MAGDDQGRDDLKAAVRWTLAASSFLLLVLAGALVWHQYELSRHAYEQRQESAETKAHEAADEIANECNIIWPPFNSLRECLAEKIAAYTEQEQADQDLKAQQDMAFWALGTFLVGAVSAVFGLGGLVALVISLRQTRQAIKNDREIGEAQVRPFLSVELIPMQKEIVVEYGRRPDFSVEIENVGNSPAWNLRYVAIASKFTSQLPVPCDDLVRPKDEIDRMPAMIIPAKSKIAGTVDSKLEWQECMILMSAKTNEIYCVAGVIWYRDVFRRDRKRRFCFRISTEMQGTRTLVFKFAPTDQHNDEE